MIALRSCTPACSSTARATHLFRLLLHAQLLCSWLLLLTGGLSGVRGRCRRFSIGHSYKFAKMYVFVSPADNERKCAPALAPAGDMCKRAPRREAGAGPLQLQNSNAAHV